jgi:hypothetical protein
LPLAPGAITAERVLVLPPPRSRTGLAAVCQT